MAKVLREREEAERKAKEQFMKGKCRRCGFNPATDVCMHVITLYCNYLYFPHAFYCANKFPVTRSCDACLSDSAQLCVSVLLSMCASVCVCLGVFEFLYW